MQARGDGTVPWHFSAGGHIPSAGCRAPALTPYAPLGPRDNDPVNDTVAVALITSLSTLTAAGLAGWVSTRTTGRQLRHQAALAREERAERRATDHRETRREAYERFLSRADAAYRLLDEHWLAGTPPTQAGFAARRALDEACIRVGLVGPEHVAERAAAVVRAVTEEFRTHTPAASASPDPTNTTPLPRAQALRARSATTADFLTAARRALDDE
jgi:hypothetical protein